MYARVRTSRRLQWENAFTHAHCQVEVPLPLCPPVSRAHALSRFTCLRARVACVSLSAASRDNFGVCIASIIVGANTCLFPLSVSVPPRYPVVDRVSCSCTF